MLQKPTIIHPVTLAQMLASGQEIKKQARLAGAELVVHLHPGDLLVGENERNPYGYRGIKQSGTIFLADKIVIHLAEGGQFIAKDKWNTQGLGVLPPFVRSGATAKGGLGWRVAVAASMVMAGVAGVTFDLSRNSTLVVLFLLAGFVLIRSLGEVLGEDLGVLPGDEGPSHPNYHR